MALGYAMKADVKLEEIDTKSNDILAVEGKVNSTKCRIVLCYFDCTKQLRGRDFDRNRSIQKQVEELMEVDPNTALLILGDFNGRLTRLEPSIKTDANGEMIDTWIDKWDLFHLNSMDTCIGKYTFDSLNGKSAIDHVLTNGFVWKTHWLVRDLWHSYHSDCQMYIFLYTSPWSSGGRDPTCLSKCQSSHH